MFVSQALTIRGLKFTIQKEELQTMTFSDLIRMKMAPGHLIYFPADTGKAFLVLKAGEYVDHEFIDKYQARGLASFYVYPVVNEAFVQEGQRLFLQLQTARLEEDRHARRLDILHWFANSFWRDQTEASILDLVFVAHRVFSRLGEEVTSRIKDTSLILFNRAQQMGALSVIVGLAIGHTDFEFLSDLYHAGLLLDYGLMDKGFTYLVALACEKERETMGSGLEYINAMTRGGQDYKIFLAHPELGYRLASADCADAVHSLDIFSLIRKHHECRDGQGFPNQIHGGIIAEWESIPILLDRCVPFRCEGYERRDGAAFFKRLMDQLPNDKRVDGIIGVRLVDRVRRALDETRVKREAA